MTPETDDNYCMRGHRVPALDQRLIRDVAHRVCEIIRIRKTSFKSGKAENLVSRLEHYGIQVDVIEDEEWLDYTRATVDPNKGMIYVPNKLYTDLCRGKAEAVRIFLHEIGHIVLGHKPLLHFSEGKATKHEDSEWQADFFADSVIELLGLPKTEMQMEFKF
ncbi:ImmA/IrrE family metallo-endopeptidase [Pseudomonas sp. R3.Fl]|uniref:ImmA/IrrE family metallo-endopeptidase n=1 Tax=Pseudomonas sp. R3.Fl TaxID=2928708 RepID=UPI00201E2517|nr:ImmA/IrrE family metallo-endopeptidase [Pseudomonas sp. R3.Fl]MCL6691047.1 ImmA/IrrE family metallo-endopeptidase [Pseudomonas sp. R3.Fl]